LFYKENTRMYGNAKESMNKLVPIIN